MNTTPEFGAPPTPEQRAGEYVLGLMRGMERAQFETEMARDPELTRAVAFWEEGPNRLHSRLRYVKVSTGWRIERLSP